ncbi:MAG: aldose 1-epimerase [bacterium]
MSFEIRQLKSDGFTVYELAEKQSGAVAKVAPALGFNLFSLHLPVDGQPIPVLVEPKSMEELKAGPSRYGNPILFPFPNRIDQGRYTWQGKTYETPAGNGAHAIHGYAHKAAWRVTKTTTDEHQASISAAFQISRDAPEHLPHWPTDAALELTYTLKTDRLIVSARVANPSQAPLPWGLGYHTYFNLPLTPEGASEKTSVVIPASRRWQLSNFIPTGDKAVLPPELDLRHGRSMQGLKADDVLTDVAHDADGRTVCRLSDFNKNLEVKLVTDRQFRELVLFTPSWNSRAIAIEPYTQTTDAINLAAKGVDGGLRVLEPGQSAELAMTIELGRLK